MATPAYLLTRNRADLSQFLIHLTKDGTHEVFNFVAGPPRGYFVTNRTVVAQTSLTDILTNRQIEARSPFGYFKLKINRQRHPGQQVWNNGDVDPDWIKSVCFSEAPLKELRHFYSAVVRKRNTYRKYGLGFWQERIRVLGGNPISYIDSRKATLLAVLNSFVGAAVAHFEPMMHLLETFGPLVIPGAAGYSDFRWEREWRKKGNLDFAYTDVAFGICPAAEIQHFEQLAGNQIPFLDPDWDEPTLTAYLRANAPQLLNHF